MVNNCESSDQSTQENDLAKSPVIRRSYGELDNTPCTGYNDGVCNGACERRPGNGLTIQPGVIQRGSIARADSETRHNGGRKIVKA